MRTLHSRWALSAMTMLCFFGCTREEAVGSCDYQYTDGVINAISGPDSLNAGVQSELTIDVSAPDRCVSDIQISFTKASDSEYFLNAQVQYHAGVIGNCVCMTSEHHYVRVFFSAPAPGTIYLLAGAGIGPAGPSYSVRVY